MYCMESVPIVANPKEHQIKCIEDSIEKLKNNYSIFNTASTGSGKGWAGGFIAARLKLNLFVVAPKNMFPDWEKIKVACGVENIIIISYDSLAGKGLSCKHPYLKKIGEDYEPTSELMDIIKQRYLFVFDEIDEAKNPDSQRLSACHAITRSIVKSNSDSRILLLSATMIDKKKYSESIFKMLGIVSKKEIMVYNPSRQNYIIDGYGYEEIYKYCYNINPDLTRQIHPHNINSKNMNNALYDMLCKIVKPKLGVTIHKPSIKAVFHPSIDYYTVSESKLVKLKEHIDMLRSYVFTLNKSESKGQGSPKIMTYLHTIENEMLELLVKISYDGLVTHPDRKFIIYVWFDSSVDYLLQVFEQFKPLRCDGKVEVAVRQENMKLFQQNNLDYRLIIAKPLAFSKGISLDDQYGGIPRETICIPNYHFNLIHQAAGRTYRTSTKSDSYFSLVFIKDADILDILTKLEEKSEVSHDIMVEYSDEENVTIYPKDYPKIYH